MCNIKSVSFPSTLENFTLDWIFYTTSGCDGCDKYEVWLNIGILNLGILGYCTIKILSGSGEILSGILGYWVGGQGGRMSKRGDQNGAWLNIGILNFGILGYCTIKILRYWGGQGRYWMGYWDIERGVREAGWAAEATKMELD